MNRASLIPTSRLRERAKRRKIKQWSAFSVVLTAMLVLGTLVLMNLWAPGPGTAMEITRVRREVAHGNSQLASLRAQSAKSQMALDSIKEVVERPDWSRLLAGIAHTRGDEILLTNCQLGAASAGAGGNFAAASDDESTVLQLRLNGIGRSQEAISAFVMRLQKFPIFTRVQLVQTTQQQFMGFDAFSFQVSCTLYGQEGGSL